MALFKRFTCVVFTVLMALSLSSCEKNSDIDESTSNKKDTVSVVDTAVSESENIVYKFDKDKLFETNLISNHLKTYKSVKIISKHDGAENIEQYFLYDGKTVFAQKWKNSSDNSLNEGWIKGFYVEYADGQYTATVNPDDVTGDEAECPYDASIIYAISDFELEMIKETEDSFIFNLNSEGQADEVIHTCTVDKKTHNVTNIYYETPEGYISTTDYIYGEDVDDFGLTDGFADTKKVTIHFNYIVNDVEENKTVTYTVPSEWMLIPSIYDDYTLYSNMEYTQMFEYPGHGEDYTIYATYLKG